ncbi:Rpr2-domain-containing protein [Cristinia sonorae]|uniref:Rpr2-domain-containing protein n=1 Tax=Cristinia sonorae TaxID=1940300 RepID=A0A8K0UY88_9AGAR|nr:Rpr2-domain-containing protein [Cristinia sonorae]
MAKKGKDEAPNPSSVANRDILQRMNFLYQASAFLNTIVDPPAVPEPPSPPVVSSIASTPVQQERQLKIQRKRVERLKKRHPPTCAALSRSYINSMKIIGQKTNVKLDPAVKRTICKSCNVVLMPGATATVRVKSSSTHGNMMLYTCMSCKQIRRIPAPPTLHPQVEDPDSAVQDESMAVDSATVEAARKKRGKTRKNARLPPLFDRDVGHVLFKGNEEVSIKDRSRFMCS